MDRGRQDNSPSSPVPRASTPTTPRARSGLPCKILSSMELLKYNTILQHLKQQEIERNESDPLISSSSSSFSSTSLSCSKKSVIPFLCIEALSNLSIDLQTFLEARDLISLQLYHSLSIMGSYPSFIFSCPYISLD